MAEIKPTRIGTPNPIDICTGIALLPGVGSVSAGNTAAGEGEKIFSKSNKRIALWRFTGSAHYALVAGICGPAYAAKFVVSGETNDKNVTLTVSDDRADAGIVAGLKVVFPVVLQVDQGIPKWTWKNGWGLRWVRAFRIDKKPEIDFIKLLVDLIKKLMKEKKKSSDIKKGEDIEKEDKKKPGVKIKVSAWGIFDSAEDQFNTNNGTIAPSPTLTIVINIVPMWPELEAIDKGLKAVWGGLSLGPKLHIIVPVFISFRRVYLDGQEVKSLEYSGGKLTGELSTAPDSVEVLRVDVSHRPTLTLGVSFFLSISVCKKFSLDPETPILRLDQLLGVEVGAGPYCTGFTNTVGNEKPSADQPFAAPCEGDAVKVVLDP